MFLDLNVSTVAVRTSWIISCAGLIFTHFLLNDLRLLVCWTQLILRRSLQTFLWIDIFLFKKKYRTNIFEEVSVIMR